MKETNVTSIQPLSWITSGVGQCMQWMLAGLVLFLGSVDMAAQTLPGPNCSDLNASIDRNGYARVQILELLTNEPPGAGPVTVDVKVENSYGGAVQFYLVDNPVMPPNATHYNGFAQDVSVGLWMFIYGCPYVDKSLKVTFTSRQGAWAAGSCWSALTFKQSNGPIVPDTTKYLYCLEEEVGDWGLYLDRFYGDKDNKYEPSVDVKYAYVPCFGQIPASFVADWIDPYPCILGNDTAKIIYREFEAFDKNGKEVRLLTRSTFGDCHRLR
ncbi:MAG: hypothetical protein IPL46_11405 [Saprospiraceae bacterium]|nr:hypothetical protein [Saprospiraceae bacterium]